LNQLFVMETIPRLFSKDPVKENKRLIEYTNFALLEKIISNDRDLDIIINSSADYRSNYCKWIMMSYLHAIATEENTPDFLMRFITDTQQILLNSVKKEKLDLYLEKIDVFLKIVPYFPLAKLQETSFSPLLHNEISLTQLCDFLKNLPINEQIRLICYLCNTYTMSRLIAQGRDLEHVLAVLSPSMQNAVFSLIAANALKKPSKKTSNASQANINLDNAIQNGNLIKTASALFDGADVNWQPAGSRSTPLMLAIRFHPTNIELVQLLLTFGAKTNLTNLLGETALFDAINSESYPIVTLLLKNGASVQHANNKGETPLMAAVQRYYDSHENLAVTEDLLKAGAEVNAVDNKGNIAIGLARSSVRINLLIKYGASRDLIAHPGQTKLMSAVCRSDVELINKLLDDKNLDIDERNDEGKTALIMLLQRGAYSFSELVHKFMLAGANLELADNNGRTALLCCNFYEGAQLLIEKYQANINVISSQNETILFNAINQLPFPYTELLNGLVTLLCSKKPSHEMLNVKSLGAGETALFMLVQLSSKSIDTEKYKTIISNLLEAGADPYISCHGQTVFDISQGEIQKLLRNWKIKQQTVINKSNTNILSAGLTPSSNLLFFKDNGLIRYHFKHPTEGLGNNYSHYVDLERELTGNEFNQLSQILRLFPHGNHCLWYETFVDTHFQHVPQELLFIAANAYDGLGNTVLGVAAETGTQLQAAQLLIDMGANVNTPEHRTKRLALHWAICNKKSYFDKTSYQAVEIVSLLLKNGADTELRCYQNSTPLEYARSKGYIAAADLIETHNRYPALFRF
jgi:uncharacterized protein